VISAKQATIDNFRHATAVSETRAALEAAFDLAFFHAVRKAFLQKFDAV
jgi:hypothetical protein